MKFMSVHPYFWKKLINFHEASINKKLLVEATFLHFTFYLLNNTKAAAVVFSESGFEMARIWVGNLQLPVVRDARRITKRLISWPL
jgi:hypothetical protein